MPQPPSPRAQRGTFLKLSEKGSNRPRSNIIIPAAGIQWFVRLIDYYIAGAAEPSGWVAHMWGGATPLQAASMAACRFHLLAVLWWGCCAATAAAEAAA